MSYFWFQCGNILLYNSFVYSHHHFLVVVYNFIQIFIFFTHLFRYSNLVDVSSPKCTFVSQLWSSLVLHYIWHQMFKGNLDIWFLYSFMESSMVVFIMSSKCTFLTLANPEILIEHGQLFKQHKDWELWLVRV